MYILVVETGWSPGLGPERHVISVSVQVSTEQSISSRVTLTALGVVPKLLPVKVMVSPP